MGSAINNSQTTYDIINKPSHYAEGRKYEPIEVMEDWGLLNLAKKIKNYKKAFYIHYKFEGNGNT